MKVKELKKLQEFIAELKNSDKSDQLVAYKLENIIDSFDFDPPKCHRCGCTQFVYNLVTHPRLVCEKCESEIDDAV